MGELGRGAPQVTDTIEASGVMDRKLPAALQAALGVHITVTSARPPLDSFGAAMLVSPTPNPAGRRIGGWSFSVSAGLTGVTITGSTPKSEPSRQENSNSTISLQPGHPNRRCHTHEYGTKNLTVQVRHHPSSLANPR